MAIFKVLKIIKFSIKKLWSFKENIKIIYNYYFDKLNYYPRNPKVYYGGALKGNVGGPSVKIQKLDNFAKKLLIFNKKHNLISKNTE